MKASGEAMNDDAAHDGGEIIEARGESLIVGCGHGGRLGLIEVQPEGKRRMSVRDALNGMRVVAGERFE